MKTMSDILHAFSVSKFKQNISLSADQCLNYVKKECVAGDSKCFTVNIQTSTLEAGMTLERSEACFRSSPIYKFLTPPLPSTVLKLNQIAHALIA